MGPSKCADTGDWHCLRGLMEQGGGGQGVCEGECGSGFTVPPCRYADIQPVHLLLVRNSHLWLLLWSVSPLFLY